MFVMFNQINIIACSLCELSIYRIHKTCCNQDCSEVSCDAGNDSDSDCDYDGV